MHDFDLIIIGGGAGAFGWYPARKAANLQPIECYVTSKFTIDIKV